MEQTIKIRSLCRKDRVILTAMFKKLAGSVEGNRLSNIIVSDSPEKKESKADSDDVFTRIGSTLIGMLIEFFEEDITAWFLDLTGKTKEEFDKSPFDAEAQIVEQLLEAKEVEDFFIRALRIFKKTKEFAGRAKNEKTK